VQLDLDYLARSGFLTPGGKSPLAEEFRILKRPLLANARPVARQGVKNGTLIMVTSSVPSEGKTYTSINLAMSIAMEPEREVVLVDGDVARPSLVKTLRLPPSLGLLDLLETAPSTQSLAQVILRTNVPRLSILTSGKPRPQATEMLASGAMNRLLDLLTANQDRIVIFDSPPLLATSEARAMATRMGQIVFVVHAEKTRQQEVTNALATIEACPVKLLVLNGATLPSQGAYGYGYGYGYGE
jgi:exopolysaccharide/PEP-CTERM locus tyrosine autokinase